MIYNHKFISLILHFILLLTFQVQSQSFLITKYSTDTGLPDNRVNDIAQDSLGRIWIAMASGIAMYDGYEWTKFGEKDGVPEVDYKKIRVDEKGVIWFMPINLHRFKLCYYKQSKWNTLKVDDLFTTSRMGLLNFGIIYRENKYEIYLVTFKSGILKFSNGKWQNLYKKNGLDCDSIFSFTILNKNIIVSTNNGFFESKLDDFCIFKKIHKYNSLPFLSFVIQSDSLYSSNLIGIKESSIEILKEYQTIFSKNLNIPKLGIFGLSSIAVHQNGDIFFGNTASIFRLNRKTNVIHRVLIENINLDRGASKIFVDFEGNIWLPGLRGIYKLQYSPFINFDKNSGLFDDEVTAIGENQMEEMFFGHNYGISVKSSNGTKNIKLRSPETTRGVISRITDLQNDNRNNTTYCVANRLGIIVIKSGISRLIKIPKVSVYYSVFINKKGRVFVATDMGLFQITNQFQCQQIFNLNNLSRKLLVEGDTLFYLANNTGLIKCNRSEKKFIRSNNPEADNLYSFLYKQQNQILIGSAIGLYRVQNDSLIKFNFNEQDITDPIYFIIQDSLKNIWLGTNNGVLKWDGKNLKRYNKSDGLAGNETNRAAGFVDSKGNVWIGTDEGVSMYTGNEPDYSKYPPKVLLLNFKDHSNQNYNINSIAKVDPDKNNLTFSYRGLSYIDEKRNLYEIRLVEVDGDYQNEFTTKSTSTRFNNLAAGDYIFSVRVQNAKGIWSPWKNSAIITVKEHFYNQTLFYLSVLGFFLVAAYTINNYFQQKRYTKKLEFAVNERTKDLKETQNQLVTSLDRYKGIVESQTDLVIRFTPDGILTYVNDAYCAVFGKIPKEIIGKSFVPLIHPEDVEATFEVIKKLNDPPYRSTLEQRDFTISGYRWFSWEGYAFRNQFADIVEIQAVGRDITLQKEVEAELEKRVYERTIELQSLISQSPLGILTFDDNGNLISYNKIASEMFCSLDDYISKKEMNLFEDELLLKNNYKEKLLNLDTPNSFLLTVPIKIDKIENKIYQKLQDHFLVYRIYNVMFDEKNKMYVLLVDDVTEQQQTDEISKKLVEEKIRISAIIKTIETERERFSKELHDGLGQLLTTAKLKLDIIKIKSDESVKEVNDTLNILINAGDEIRRIISDLKPADVESFGLVSSIELLVERIKQASKVNILLAVLTNIQIEKKEHEIVVYRIIQEALNNIVKHSKCNRAIIELSIFNNELLLKISDDGVGIDLKKQNQKFKSYGVQNIKERVSSLNGKVEIESEPGKGFKYSINIPL